MIKAQKFEMRLKFSYHESAELFLFFLHLHSYTAQRNQCQTPNSSKLPTKKRQQRYHTNKYTEENDTSKRNTVDVKQPEERRAFILVFIVQATQVAYSLNIL